MAGFRTDIEKFNASVADIIKQIEGATALAHPANLLTALQSILFRLPLRWPTIGFHLEYPTHGEDLGNILLLMQIVIPKARVPFLLTQEHPTKVWVHAKDKDQEFDVYSQSFHISLFEYEASYWSGANVYEDRINEAISWFVRSPALYRFDERREEWRGDEESNPRMILTNAQIVSGVGDESPKVYNNGESKISINTAEQESSLRSGAGHLPHYKTRRLKGWRSPHRNL